MPPKTNPFARKKKAKEPQKLYKCAFCEAQQDHPSKNEDGQSTCDNCGEEIYLNRNYNGEPAAAEPAPAEDIDARADEERAEETPEPEPEPVEEEAPKFRIQRKPRTEKLPVKLTDEERLAYGKEMADLLAEAEQIDRETKQFKKAQDSKLAGVEAKLSERSIAISNGYEHRNVNCELVMDYEQFEVYLLRLDTYEVVERRKMSNDERQMQLTAE